MKKIITVLLVILILVTAGAYLVYNLYFTDLVAGAIVSDEMPPYIPRRIQNKIESIRKPLHEGVDDAFADIQKSSIPLERVLHTIDHTTEEQAYAILDDLNDQKPKTTDEAFDIAKKHLDADFDLEVLRNSFNKHVTMRRIQSAMRYGNMNRKTQDIDFETTKAILRKIILEKQKELDNSL